VCQPDPSRGLARRWKRSDDAVPRWYVSCSDEHPVTQPKTRRPRAADEQSIVGSHTEVPVRSATADRVPVLDVNLDEVDWDICLRDFGGALRKLRESAGLSQRDLGRVSGVSQGAVSRFEAGRRRGIPAHVMLKIAVALARQPATVDRPLAQEVRQLLEALVRVVLAGQSG
jgi:DNA-binding XRE family transcriptional regulator